MEFVNFTNPYEESYLKWGKEFLKRCHTQYNSNFVMKLHREEALDTSIAVVGLPNVGKTTFMNVLRSCGYSDAAVASIKYANVNNKYADKLMHGVKHLPGSTNAVQEKVKVSANPIIYVTDTPGIFHKQYPSIQEVSKLTMANILKDTKLGMVAKADYILFELNRQRNFQYVEVLNMKEPCDDIQTVLLIVAEQNNLHGQRMVMTGLGKRQIRTANYDNAAEMFIKAFNSKLFGRLFWDQDILDTERIAVQGSLLNYGVTDASEGKPTLSNPFGELNVDFDVSLAGADSETESENSDYSLNLPKNQPTSAKNV